MNKANILIVGSGAREHAIAAALQRGKQTVELFCYGTSTNPFIKQMTRGYCVGNLNEIENIIFAAREWNCELAIIGPEAPLEKGLADALWQAGIQTIGPKKALAQIETNKTFARELMQQYAIPGLPAFRTFHDLNGVPEFLAQLGEGNYVIKANGLMGGKGVKVAGDHLHSFAESLTFCAEIIALGQSFIIEEKLLGQEFSFMCFCDGETLAPMPLVQDHKRAFVDDKGPNTGGMGSYSDANHSLPFLTPTDVNAAWEINKAVITALTQEVKDKYIGILYGSFIATRHGVYVIEFNARFGDPESLNVLTILESDLAAICKAMVNGNLQDEQVKFANKATVCKYAVPHGYPNNPVKHAAIDIGAVKNKTQLYLAAVDLQSGVIFATGSRTAAYVGVADTIFDAERIAEKEVCGIAGPLFHREDIGTKALIERRIAEMQELRT